MIVKVSVSERINLGNYEHTEIRAAVEFDTDEVTGDPAAFAQEQLDGLLRSHRRRTLDLLPEDSESFITYHPALEN